MLLITTRWGLVAMLGYASTTVHWVPLCLLYACRHSSRSHAYTETYTRATPARKGDKLIYRASSRCNNMQLFTGSAHTTLLIQVCMMLSLSLSVYLYLVIRRWKQESILQGYVNLSSTSNSRMHPSLIIS